MPYAQWRSGEPSQVFEGVCSRPNGKGMLEVVLKLEEPLYDEVAKGYRLLDPLAVSLQWREP